MKAIKVKIYPNNKQKVLIEKHFGCCRFAYNFGLELKTKAYTETKKSIGIYTIQKEIPKLYEEKPWLKEVNSQSIQQSLKDLDLAYQHFFKKNNSFPKFKNKYNPKQSFRVPQFFEVNRDKKVIKIPKIKWLKFRDKFNISKDIEFRNITISKDNNEYFASICYQENNPNIIPELSKIEEEKTLGIDLGITYLAILSNETKIDNPKHYNKYQEKLAFEQRKLSNKLLKNGNKKDTKSYQKQKEKVGKIHKKISNTRKDFLHKLTNSIVENQNYTSYVMEDLAVKELEQNNYTSMSKAIGDVSWRMLRTLMIYKCENKGKNLIIIGKFEPSSKTCSVCGNIYQKLGREEKVWKCEKCNTFHDRDINAAKNIRDFGLIKSLGKDFSERSAS